MLSRSIVGYPVMALVLSLLLASSLKVAAFVPRTTVGAATVGRRGIASATASPSALPFQASNCRHRGVAPVTQLQALPSGGGGGVDTGSLTTFFLQTLIANGIPALFTIAVIGFAATMFRKKDSSSSNTNRSMVSSLNNPAAKLYNDLYGDQEQEATTASSGLRRLFGSSSNNNNNVSLPKNTGVPARQYIKLTNWNRKLDSYQYSVTAAVQSQAAAAAAYRQGSLNRALQQATKLSSTTTTATATSNLSPSALRKLQEAEQHFLSQGAALQQDILDLQTKLTAAAVDEELAGMGVADAYELDPAELESADPANTTSTAVVTNSAKGKTVKKKKGKTRKQVNAWMTALTTAQRELQQTELDFIQDLVAAVGPSRAAAVRTALTGDTAGRGAGGLLLKLQATGDRPLLSALLDPNATNKPSSVFVMRFPGDASASQVAELREEVTAVVRQAAAGDEAVVILQTGGGTVTGYGLAAAQLMRFKEAGMKLTVAVEQVAASGGYMMCCVADRIVASPFAVLGSIGVISDIPNVYERLKKEGIEFQTVTAGKYKRTLTPTKKPTKGDFGTLNLPDDAKCNARKQQSHCP